MGSIIYREASLAPLVSNAHILVGNTNGVSRLDFNEYWKKSAEDKEGDLIIQLIIDEKYLNLPYAHVKRTKNEKIDYPLVTAVALRDGEDINISFSGLCDLSFRSREIEEVLKKPSLSINKKLEEIMEKRPCQLLDDNNGSPNYRKFILSHILKEIIDRLGEGDHSA